MGHSHSNHHSAHMWHDCFVINSASDLKEAEDIADIHKTALRTDPKCKILDISELKVATISSNEGSRRYYMMQT